MKLSNSEVMKEISYRWSQMDTEAKQPYNAQARQDKARYEREMELFKNKGNAKRKITESAGSENPVSDEASHHSGPAVELGTDDQVVHQQDVEMPEVKPKPILRRKPPLMIKTRQVSKLEQNQEKPKFENSMTAKKVDERVVILKEFKIEKV